MVYGFPGRTEQHVSSSYLNQIMSNERPARIRMRDLSLSVIDKAMKNSELVRIQYASKQARISNAYVPGKYQIQTIASKSCVIKDLKHIGLYQISVYRWVTLLGVMEEEASRFIHQIHQVFRMLGGSSKMKCLCNTPNLVYLVWQTLERIQIHLKSFSP